MKTLFPEFRKKPRKSFSYSKILNFDENNLSSDPGDLTNVSSAVVLNIHNVS